MKSEFVIPDKNLMPAANLRRNRYYSLEAEKVLGSLLRSADGDIEVLRALTGFVRCWKLWPELRDHHIENLTKVLNERYMPKIQQYVGGSGK